MSREGWIYAVAFVVILVVGGLIIAPRLAELDDEDAGRLREEIPIGPAPAEPVVRNPEVERFGAAPAYEPVRVTVSGEGAGLRGPLREVHGAQIVAETPADARRQTLRVRPTASVVHFGAVGHQWKAVPAGELVEGMQVELPEAVASLVVRVREPDGQPAADVPVVVEPAPPGPALRTDAGGTLVLDHLARGLVSISLASTERTGPRVRLRAGEDRDARLTLDPAWVVTGRVATPGGSPLAGALVTGLGPRGVLGRVVETDGDGRFRWSGPATSRLALRVRAAAWAERMLEVTPPAAGALVTDLGAVELGVRGVTLDGEVDAAFIEADAHVIVEPAVAAIVREVFGPGHVLDSPRREPLGADGRFRFHDLPPDLPLRVSVRGAGVPVDLIVRGAPGESVPVRLEPPRGEVLAGHVLRPDGEPAAGTRLLLSTEVRDGDRERPGDLAVLAGPDGSFRARGLGGRLYFLRAYAPGCRSLLRRVQLPLRAPLTLRFEPAVTDAPRRVTGHVYDGVRPGLKMSADDPMVGEATEIRFGRPLPGVTVRAAGVSAVTDGEGAFRLEGVESLAPAVGLAWGYEPGPLAAAADAPGAFVTAEALEVTPGGEPLQLVLRRTASLRFRAIDGIDDAPVSFVHVIVQGDHGGVLVDQGRATQDGVVRLDGLPAGGVDLALLTHDRRFVRTAIRLPAGRVTDLGDLPMPHGLRIEGRVTTATGVGIAGARVGAYGRGWQQVGQDVVADRELLFRLARTDDAGRFVVEGFDPAQPADLAIWAEGHAPTALRVVLDGDAAGMVVRPHVKLRPGGYLGLDLRERGRGRERGPVVHGALVDLESARDGSDYLDLVHHGMLGGPLASSEEWALASEHLLPEDRGADGYVIGPLRPGPYEVWVERPGYARLRKRLTVIDPGQTLLIDVMSGDERRYAGRLTRLEFEMTPDR